MVGRSLCWLVLSIQEARSILLKYTVESKPRQESLNSEETGLLHVSRSRLAQGCRSSVEDEKNVIGLVPAAHASAFALALPLAPARACVPVRALALALGPPASASRLLRVVDAHPARLPRRHIHLLHGPEVHLVVLPAGLVAVLGGALLHGGERPRARLGIEGHPAVAELDLEELLLWRGGALAGALRAWIRRALRG